MSSTPATESTKHQISNQGSASAAAIHLADVRSATWLAKMIRFTPAHFMIRAWTALAAVIPHAPASIWRCQSRGAIVVFP
jgi:hypothetical protein